MKTLNEKLGKVAIVVDDMISFGGADRVLLSTLKILPHADIFTMHIDFSKYPQLDEYREQIFPSFVQKITRFVPRRLYRHFKVLKPFAYESFDFRKYDYVISITAGPAKGIITQLDQPHISMTMTPPRSLWDLETNFRGTILKEIYKPISQILNNYLRMWDYTSSKRVDYWIANSGYIGKKILKIYRKESEVIYPGVEMKYYTEKKYLLDEEPYFLVVSRLYDHKKVDWAIRACMETHKRLIVIGEGPDKGYLENIAGDNPDIKFLGYLEEDEDVIKYLQNAEALIFPGLEDFGLAPVEAMACGSPVLGINRGGLLETIKEGVSGEFFSNEEELKELLNDFDKTRYNEDKIREHAAQFSEKEFLQNFEKYLLGVYEKRSKQT